MSLIDAFIQQCAENPDCIAFTEADRQLRYAEFYSRVQQIACVLQEKHSAGERVAVYLDRGINAATVIYAILAADACYIPLDIKNPPERINFIVHDAQPKWIIGLGDCPDWLSMSERWLDLQQLLDKVTLSLKAVTGSSDALAAILYTSGSTGMPKGVALSHQAMLNFVSWAGLTFNLKSHDRIASLAPCYFDLSVFDLFTSLANGASVHFMPAQLSLAPAKLALWLQEKAITRWYTVPSLLSFLTLKGGLDKTTLPHLQTLLFAGEIFPTPHLIKLTEQLPHVNFFNLYGPTETNVCCYWPIQRSRLHKDTAIPIGFPACGSQLKINAQTGELWVKSLNNFSGYWHRGQLQTRDLKEWYATGDLASQNEQGEYCYHGRLDRMMKCSGYRVEPAEIEHILSQSSLIEECAVIGINDSTSGQRPAAIIVMKEMHTLNEVLPDLRVKLPQYMFPSKFLVIPAIPRLANGKIDYASLPALFEPVHA